MTKVSYDHNLNRYTIHLNGVPVYDTYCREEAHTKANDPGWIAQYASVVKRHRERVAQLDALAAQIKSQVKPAEYIDIDEIDWCVRVYKRLKTRPDKLIKTYYI